MSEGRVHEPRAEGGWGLRGLCFQLQFLLFLECITPPEEGGFI